MLKGAKRRTASRAVVSDHMLFVSTRSTASSPMAWRISRSIATSPPNESTPTFPLKAVDPCASRMRAQMHARQADVAGAPRQRTLDARVLGIGRHELGAVLARSARHQRFIGVLGADRDGLPVVFLDGMDTVGALGAGATVFGRELDLDDLILP